MIMNKSHSSISLWIIFAACLFAVQPSVGQTVLLSEDFEGLDLEAFLDEAYMGDQTWTDTPPEEWSVNNDQMANGGVFDWWGWTFADRTAWSAVAGDQRRSEFTNGRGVVAITDPDEWDDIAHEEGQFNSFLISPSIDISGAGAELTISFASSWRPEVDQLGTVDVSFDGGDQVNVLTFSSHSDEADYKDDNSTNDLIFVPVAVPTGASQMTVSWGMTNAGNNWFWAIDNIVVYAGTETATVTRSFDKEIIGPAETLTISLNASLENAKDTEIVETLPTGWTAQNISDGGAFADGKITWNLSAFSGSKTLTYEAITPDTPGADIEFAGLVDSAIMVLGNYTISFIEAVGEFENHIDIGSVAVVGSAEFDNGSYILMGSGDDVWGSADGCHFAYIELSGSFSIQAKDIFANPYDSSSEWVKAGLMIRNNLTPGSANGFAVIRSDQAFRPQWRNTQDAGSTAGGDDQFVDGGVHEGNIEIVRIGSSLMFYYISSDTGQRTYHSTQVIEGLSDPVYVGFAVTSHENGAISSGEFLDLEIEMLPFEVIRSLPVKKFPWRGTIEGIELNANVLEGETVSLEITETPPADWTISNVQTSAGTANIADGVITWTLPDSSGEQQLTYDIAATEDALEGEWSGSAVGGGQDMPIGGSNAAFASFSNPGPEFRVLLAEDFEGLVLGPYVDENDQGPEVWTKTPPEGWSIDDSGVEGGVTEWRGWSFSDVNAWITVAGDQNRAMFTRAEGVVAIADPDEWDDLSEPEKSPTFTTFLMTPSIALPDTPVEQYILTFDSSWRDEDFQDVNLEISYDGGEYQEVFYWASPADDPRFKDDAENELVFLNLDIPAETNEVVLKFGMLNAGNDWWWAIDNIAFLAETGIVSVPDWSLF
jgi:LRR adjacent protein